jgi:DNA-binding IclR family transcriptional regulator
MTRSKVQFYLVSFTRIGVAIQDSGSGRYQLGPAALSLGLSALMRVDILEKTRRSIDGLFDRTGHQVCLSVWGSHGPTVIHQRDGRETRPFSVQVGAVLPVLSTATGNVFLTYLPLSLTHDLIERELKLSQRELQGGRKLSWIDVNHIISRTKQQRLARHRSRVRGFMVVAAPIFDYAVSLRCVLSILGDHRNPDLRIDGFATKALITTATSISQELGAPNSSKT